MFKIQEINERDLVSGGNIAKLMPLYTEIPKEFKYGHNKQCTVVSDWFFLGLKDVKWQPKEGIVANKAIRHIQAIMTSWEPKHEHKEAACAYLLSQWFDDIQYTVEKSD